MNTEDKITKITGTAVPVRGNDIDTDRIIPARYLKCVTFNELGVHAFEDDREAYRKKGKTHPFDNEVYNGAEFLFVNSNFGCGSSREHAPQSLIRRGIKAIVGESFAEIFFGNCVSLGLPCVILTHDKMEQLLSAAEKNPAEEWILDIGKEKINGPVNTEVCIESGPRNEFLSGTWSPLQSLLESKKEIEKVAQCLPYLSAFGGNEGKSNES